MTPTYRVLEEGTIREVYFYVVDISEFMANKLADRGSLSSRSIITNFQDFIIKIVQELNIESQPPAKPVVVILFDLNVDDRIHFHQFFDQSFWNDVVVSGDLSFDIPARSLIRMDVVFRVVIIQFG